MKTHPYVCGTRKCDLCLCEKLLIARANSASLLKKRDELVSKYRHMKTCRLKCFKNRQNVILLILFITICSFRDDWTTQMKHSIMVYCGC